MSKSLYERVEADMRAAEVRAARDNDHIAREMDTLRDEQQRQRRFESWLKVTRACLRRGWFWPGEDD